MKRRTGQAGRALATIFRQTGAAVMTVFFVAVLGAGALAYRLSLGPLEIPWAAARLAKAVSGADVEVHIGKAALTWAGYKTGSRAPLFLALGDITIRNTSGAVLATIPQAQLAFSLGALFTARAPIYVRSQNAHVMGTDAPVSLLAGIRLGAAFTLASASLQVTLGPGQLGPPGLGEPLAGGEFLLALTPTALHLSDGVLNLQPFGQSAPVIHIAATAHKSGTWHGAITLRMQAVHAEDLAHYWPARLAAATRSWVTRNITAGTARNASFTLHLSAPPHLAAVQLDSATGGFTASNLTLTWLPGVLPFTGLSGTFTLADMDDIDIAADTARLGGIRIAAARMHIAGVSQADQIASLNIPFSGTVQDAIAVLNGPNLELLKSVPPPVPTATGSLTGTVKVTLPLLKNITLAEIRMNVAAALTGVTLPLPVRGLTLRQGRLAVEASLRTLGITGSAQLSGQPASLAAKASFGGSAAAVTFDMKTTATTETLRELGWDPGSFIHGAMPVQVHVATTADSGSLKVTADLTEARMALPVFGWSKPAGKPGTFSFAAGINGDRFSGIDRIDSIGAKAPGLEVDTAISGDTINLTYVRIGNTEGSGRIVPPAGGQPWRITLTGNALDLSSVVNPPRDTAPKPAPAPSPAKPAPAQPPSGFPWDASAHFNRLLLAENPEPALTDFTFNGGGRGGFILRANAAAELAANKPVTLKVAPVPGAQGAETMQLRTNDGGALLRALGAFDHLRGGSLDLAARYGVAMPVEGVTRITNFRLLNAPALGKILQAATVLGIPEAASGPGLKFTRLIVPFSVTDQVLTLKQARAYSASLGFTASGTIDLGASLYDIHGTVVPAYALNTLPGKIPLIGKLFSPEKGGGLFAMRYSMTGPIANPKVKINPLSALTPGFLRGIFGPQNKPETK